MRFVAADDSAAFVITLPRYCVQNRILGYMITTGIRRTSDSRLVGAVRILLGVMYLLAGLVKIVVPYLRAAFSGQLSAVDFPLQELVLQLFPVFETGLGLVLVAGIYTRPAAVVSVVTMIVATWVHLAVDDPSLFPLQPVEPIGPAVFVLMSLYLLWRGAGSWSLDLSASTQQHND